MDRVEWPEMHTNGALVIQAEHRYLSIGHQDDIGAFEKLLTLIVLSKQ